MASEEPISIAGMVKSIISRGSGGYEDGGIALSQSTHSTSSLESSSSDNGVNRWSSVPVRFARYSSVGEIKPRHEGEGENWSWATFFSYAGPGFLVAIAYLDPGNLEANLQAGAYTKYELSWVLVAITSVGLILQGMAARIGIVTGKHLSQLMRQEYSATKWISLWIVSELSIIASDVQAVITSAIALKILFGLPLWLGCIVTAVDALTFLSLHLLGIRSLESFFVAIVAVMSVCFFYTFSMNPPDPVEVAGGMVPSIPSYGLATAVGIVGSLILPQNYYVHSAVVLSREVDRKNPVEVREANKYMLADAAVALFVAFLLNFAVISCFAELFFNIDCATASTTSACIADSKGFHHHHYGECVTLNNEDGYCQHIGLSDADAALEHALGGTASVVWALGLLASGQSSTMTITYAGQFINEGFGEFHIPLYQRISLCRVIALIPSVIAATLEATYPSSMDDATQIGNIIASICVPFAIVPMLKFCCSKRLMGEHTMSAWSAYLVFAVTMFLVASNVWLFWEYVMMMRFLPVFVTTLIWLVISVFYLYLLYEMADEEIRDYSVYILDSCCCCFWPQPRRTNKEDMYQLSESNHPLHPSQEDSETGEGTWR